MILYVPFFRTLFQITPLNWEEWQAVLLISAPVIAIDEVLKWVSNRLSKSFFGYGGSGADDIADTTPALEQTEREAESKKDL